MEISQKFRLDRILVLTCNLGSSRILRDTNQKSRMVSKRKVGHLNRDSFP